MRNFFAGFLIAALLFTGLGYWWAREAYTKTYEDKLWQKDLIISHYRTHWTPIRETPVRVRGK